jgi:hypothetical protein
VFDAAVQFARTEGIMLAPESAHAIRSAIDEALSARETDEQRVILFLLSRHGHFDMGPNDAYFSGQLEDYEYPKAAILVRVIQLAQSRLSHQWRYRWISPC